MLLNDTPIKTTASFHNDLLMAKELVYDKSGFEFQNYKLHSESTDYGACSFELNGNKVQYRVSKITPTKKGQFVTIWKRSDSGITVPFDVLDDVDLVIISTRCGEHFGQFIFPKSVLAEKGIMRQNGKEGKRGIRVYPPWDTFLNKQAEKTQRWQTLYFFTITPPSTIKIPVSTNQISMFSKVI